MNSNSLITRFCFSEIICRYDIGWYRTEVEFEFGRFGWSISRLTAIVSNVRSRRLQKAESTDRNYFKN